MSDEQNKLPLILGSQEDATFLETTLLQLRSAASALDSCTLRPNPANEPTNWPGEVIWHDPGFEGLVCGLKWSQYNKRWLPFVQSDTKTLDLFPSLASIAAFVMKDGHDLSAALEEHSVQDIGDCAELFDDGSILESDQLSGGHNVYSPGEWYITPTASHPRWNIVGRKS